MKNYVVSEEDLRKILEAEARYIALETEGVDNWEWYGESIRNYLNLYEADSIDEIVNKRMKEFETLWHHNAKMYSYDS